MTPRLRDAIIRSIPAGLVWGVGSSCLRWDRETHSEATRDGAILGLYVFAVTFVLAMVYQSIRRRVSKPSSK
jgi:hypothetical protein